MIRTTLQRMAGQEQPNWLVRNAPEAFWRWVFDVNEVEALMQNAMAELIRRS